LLGKRRTVTGLAALTVVRSLGGEYDLRYDDRTIAFRSMGGRLRDTLR